jgi:uncharacterized membrane protein YbaN (DUF454 family)
MTGTTFSPLLKIRKTPRSLLSRVLLVSAAVLCFVLGILGWLVPVVTGIPFYVLGLVLLGMASSSVRDWINRAEARLSPKWRRLLRAGLAKIPIRKVRESVKR